MREDVWTAARVRAATVAAAAACGLAFAFALTAPPRAASASERPPVPAVRLAAGTGAAVARRVPLRLDSVRGTQTRAWRALAAAALVERHLTPAALAGFGVGAVGSVGTAEHAAGRAGVAGRPATTLRPRVEGRAHKASRARTLRPRPAAVRPASAESAPAWSAVGHLTVEATAYWPNPEWSNGYTATGMRAGYGVVAVDPSVIPLGTHLYIPGYGQAIAADTGGAIVGDHIDVCFDTGWQAQDWGVRYVTVTIERAN